MTILAFLIVIVVLVLVHELGHFWAAKRSGMRVDEFGVGFPPRLWSTKRGETVYSINALPFGGFVKIYGENGLEIHEDASRSFERAPFHKQAITLLAGVSMNFLFAWILLSVGFLIGQPTSTFVDDRATDPMLVVTDVVPDSPADMSLKAGDTIHELSAEGDVLSHPTPETIQTFINKHGEADIEFAISRGGNEMDVTVEPVQGLVEENTYAVGIAMDMIGLVRLPIHKAFYEGGKTTIQVSEYIIIGFAEFIHDAFVGKADTGALTGPVGIAGLAGDALQIGFVNFLSFTALISIHLAILNLLPIPALDGGRLLFLLIEHVSRKKIPARVMAFTNAAAFILLISLMLFVTYRDIVRLF